MKGLMVDEAKCAGCRICEQWCAWKHEGSINPHKSRIRVFHDHENYLNIPVFCHQCTQPLCVEACPVQALSKDEQIGAIKVEADRCIGCRKCLKACPHGAVAFDPDTRKALICDLCDGKPACVAHCPLKALSYDELGMDGIEIAAKVVREKAEQLGKEVK